MPKMVGIIPADHIQMIDHIVPLCHLMDIPLCCMESNTASIIEEEYPALPLILSLEDDLEKTLAPYQVLFYSHPHRLLPDSFLFGESCLRKKAISVCSLHGNSDKKWNQFWMERLVDEDIVLLYGSQNREMLEKKGALSRIKRFVEVGNYRSLFYEEHRLFFEDKIPQWLKNKKNRKAILYAPSWQASEVHLQDRRETSSFFSFAEQLFDNLPEEYLLVFKPHPFLQRFFPEAMEKIKNTYAQKENIYFLEEYPLIYPLLSKIDIYLGDHSSIGYDFLYFDRPLVFINHNGWEKEDRAIYLHQAGISLCSDAFSSLFFRIEKELERDTHRPKREELYHYTFGEKKSLTQIKHHIDEAIACALS